MVLAGHYHIRISIHVSTMKIIFYVVSYKVVSSEWISWCTHPESGIAVLGI